MKPDFQEKLGHGGFGSVYKRGDDAVKCIELEDDGIPHLMEPSIMASIAHPCLADASHISVGSGHLYIEQRLALSDGSRWTKKHRGGHLLSINQLREWSYCLVQAVLCLHRASIIHCDIKASNVLLFENNNVKLADFSLAI